MRLTAVLPSLALASAALAHGVSGAGEPGDPRAPARVVEVTAREGAGGMAFTPARVEARRGETIRFVVRNAGALAHEFVIGTRDGNAAHKRMMAAMPDMTHNDPNAVTVAPGHTAKLTWRFVAPGVYEFACLIPGHYEAGMHGVAAVQ